MNTLLLGKLKFVCIYVAIILSHTRDQKNADNLEL